MSTTLLKSLFLLLSVVALSASSVAQNDSLEMINGDILVGEIKGLESGVLTLKTKYSDKDFKIDWDDVVRVKSFRNFIVHLSHGRKLFGSILPDQSDSAKVIIVDIKERVVAPLDEIVYIKPVKKSFFGRFGGMISAGYTLTKANNSHQISISSNLDYTSSSFLSNAYYSFISNFQKQDSTEIRTTRMEGGLAFNIFLYRGWVAMLGTDLLQNEEQKIKLRANTKAGVGNFIVRNNKLFLLAGGGGAWNYETYSDTSNTFRNNLEAYASINFNIYNIGDLEVNTTVTGYAGLTDWGRLRSDFSFDLKYDFFLDFFINLGFIFNYDNRPVAGASNIDYVLQTTVGWDL